MKLEPGRFRHIITIQTPDNSVLDPLGDPRPRFKTLYANIPAEVSPISSRDLWSAGQAKAQATHRVYVLYAPGINSTCRVLYESRTFSVTGVIDMEERRTLLELSCLEQVD